MKIIFTLQQKTPQDEPCGVFELSFQEYDYSQDQDLIDFKPEYLIVAFSPGCVYPLVGVESCGGTEEMIPALLGEYSQA